MARVVCAATTCVPEDRYAGASGKMGITAMAGLLGSSNMTSSTTNSATTTSHSTSSSSSNTANNNDQLGMQFFREAGLKRLQKFPMEQANATADALVAIQGTNEANGQTLTYMMGKQIKLLDPIVKLVQAGQVAVQPTTPTAVYAQSSGFTTIPSNGVQNGYSVQLRPQMLAANQYVYPSAGQIAKQSANQFSTQFAAPNVQYRQQTLSPVVATNALGDCLAEQVKEMAEVVAQGNTVIQNNNMQSRAAVDVLVARLRQQEAEVLKQKQFNDVVEMIEFSNARGKEREKLQQGMLMKQLFAANNGGNGGLGGLNSFLVMQSLGGKRSNASSLLPLVMNSILTPTC